MGLADFLNDPQVLAGLQMLSQSRDPQMSGQAVSGGLAQMLAMKQAEQQKAMQQQQMQLHQMQLQRMQQQQSDEAAQREFYAGAGNYMRSPQQQAIGMGGPSPQAAAMIPQLKPQFDKAAALRDMMQVPGLQQNAFAAMMKPPERMKVAANERVLDENMKELVPAIDKGEEVKDSYLVKRDGKWVPDMDLYNLYIGAKRAGAPSVNNKIDVKTGESIAAQVGPILKTTREQAIAGQSLLDSSSRVLAAVEKGNVIAGPTANLRFKGAQIADLFGVGGKDTKEKILNTRNVIRAQAEQAVAARSQLGGQAQISNAEQELITKATSGDIADLTMAEMKQIAQLNQRLGKQLVERHNMHVRSLEGDPGLAGLAKFYKLPAEAPQGGGIKFLGFE